MAMSCLFICGCWPNRLLCTCPCRKKSNESNMKNSKDEEKTNATDVECNSSYDATEIFPYLYLGGLGNRSTDFLTEKNITGIINASNMDPKKIIGCSQPYDIDELVVPLGDAQVCNISEFFGTAGEMIDAAEKSEGTILVHCAAGISRSTTLVLAYLMKYKKMSLKDAHDFVKSKRKVIKPNPGFWNQLIDFETELFGSSSVQMIEDNSAGQEANENTRLIPDIYKVEVKTGRF